MNRGIFWGVTCLVLIASALPYLLANRAAGPGFVFGGFLMNPVDGHSYLAKMAQGAAGEWKFTLPYTAEPGEGAYIHLYYLALGHLAALTGLPNLLVYHLARLVGAGFMLFSLFRFLWAILEDDPTRRFAFILSALGSGLGWLAAPFGGFTADFWVAEAYPFLSALTNPHFPLGLGMILWVLTPPSNEKSAWFPYIFWGLAMGLVSPFGLTIAIGVLGVFFGVTVLGWVKAPWVAFRLSGVMIGGGGILLYDLWAIQQDPVMRGWNAQNLTPSPPLIDLIIAFSPALMMAIVGVWMVVRGRKEKYALLAVWILLVLGLLYLPFNLQRRLLTGFFVPVAALAAAWLHHSVGGQRSWFGRLAALTVAVSLLTNVFILAAGVFGAQTHDPLLYTSQEEADAFRWIAASTAPDAIILAAPVTGMWIPSQTGRRVLYGHVFETVNAESEEAAVLAIYRGEWPGAEVRAYLENRGVEYIFIGPQERELGAVAGLEGYPLVYESRDVQVYAVFPTRVGQ